MTELGEEILKVPYPAKYIGPSYPVNATLEIQVTYSDAEKVEAVTEETTE